MVGLIEDSEALGTLKLKVFAVMGSIVDINPSLVFVVLVTDCTGVASHVRVGHLMGK